MYRYSVSLAFLFTLLCVAVPARAAQGAAQQTRRVWTTQDVNALSSAGLISIVGPEVEAEAPAAPAPAPESGPVYSSRLQDPAWYAEQAAQLQTEMDATNAALAQARANLEQAESLQGGIGGVNLLQYPLAVTPGDVIANLEAHLRDLQSQMDDLADLARRNDIPPGVLRGATS